MMTNLWCITWLSCSANGRCMILPHMALPASEPDQIWHICPLYHRLVPNSAKFRENIEIPRKWTKCAARLKILRCAENCDESVLSEIIHSI